MTDLWTDEEGASTAEYAIVTMAAVAIAEQYATEPGTGERIAVDTSILTEAELVTLQ